MVLSRYGVEGEAAGVPKRWGGCPVLFMLPLGAVVHTVL